MTRNWHRRITIAVLAGFLAATSASAIHRADMLIGKTRTNLKGNDKYGSPTGQAIRVAANPRAKFFVRMEHDLNEINAIATGSARITLGGQGHDRFRVAVFRLTGGRKNVTARITGGGLAINELPFNQHVDLLVKARRPRSSKNRKSLNFERVEWTFKGILKAGIETSRDRVRAKVIAK